MTERLDRTIPTPGAGLLSGPPTPSPHRPAPPRGAGPSATGLGSHRSRRRGLWALATLSAALLLWPALVGADPLREAPPRACGLASRPAGVHTHLLDSRLLGRALPLLVWEPPGLAAGERAPLIVLLHGLGARPATWLEGPRIHEQLAAAMRAGALRRAIVALPTGEDGYWTDWTDGAHPWGRVVVEEVVPAVRAAYPTLETPATTAIAGVSMGAFGALSLGLRHPEVFGTIVALSPTDMALAVEDEPGRKVYRDVFGSPADPAAVRAVNPRDLVAAGAGGGQHVILVVGDAEPRKFAEGTPALARALEERHVPVVLRVVPGGRHDFATTWTRSTQRWWMERLQEAWPSRPDAPDARPAPGATATPKPFGH